MFGTGFRRTVETEIVGIWSSKTCVECFSKVSSLRLLSSLRFWNWTSLYKAMSESL